MARYDTDDRTLYRRDYDRTDDRSRYDRYSDRDDDLRDARRNLRDEFEGYEREDGRTRWDYAGRGPEDNVLNYPRDRGLRESEGLDRGSRYGRARYDDDRYDGDRFSNDYSDRNRSDEDYLQERYDRDYVRDFGDHNGYVGRYERGRQGYRRGPHAGLGPEGYTRSPERMTERVNERLTDDDHVDASGIQVTAENGEVTLTGTVSDRGQKRRAEDVAESVRGVDDVHNRLTINRDSDV